MNAELIHISPTDVVVGANVRHAPRLDKAFTASVRERGVLVPIVGHRDEEGRFVVLYGQRRTLAAVETNQPTIPAYVVDGHDEADRLIDQMAENDHRASLTTGEKAKAFEQLAALGLSAGQIAKRTATKRAHVDTALTIAGSEIATKAADRFDFLTLDQAATIAEFEDDHEAVKALTIAAKQGEFDHVAQRLRDDRAEAALLDEAKQSVEADGTTYIDAYDNYGEHAKAAQLRNLAAAADTRDPIEPEQHKTCPGHAAYAATGWEWREVGGEDHRVRVARVHYVCLDPKKHGHHDRYASTSSPSKPKAADMTDEQREQARAQRREVIDNNKAWDAAETVRLAWVKTFLTRKTAPKGAAALIAHALTGDWTTKADVSHHRVPEVARALGVETNASQIEKATDGRALVLALGRVLAAYEAQTSRQSWRSTAKHTALYLRFLADNGYELSSVEHRAAGTTRTGK